LSSKKYKQWRKSVYERDKYTCRICGQVGHKLNAHHIQNYAEFHENRYDIENGITLCVDCHKAFHDKYGKKSNKEKLKQFVNNYQNEVKLKCV